MDRYGRLLHDVLFPGFEAARGRPTVSLMRYLDRTQWASRDELHAIQSGLLRRLLRHAHRHSAWYRETLDRAGIDVEDIRGPEDLHRLPLLEKDDARASIDGRTCTAPPFAVIHKTTTGSTGQPMTVSYNAESRFWRDATRWRGYGWAGYRPGMRALHFWGQMFIKPKSLFARAKLQLDRALQRNRYVDCTPRGDDHLATVVEQIRAYQPQVIVTYSQAGAALARYVNRTGSRTWDDLPVIVGAERLFDHDRQAIDEAFGKVFETYGSREFMMTGAECDLRDGLHTAMESQIVEIIVRNPDGTTRAAKPGESGEVVVTDLHNLAVPFIRYVNSDLAVQRRPERCACGRWLERIGPIEGRLMETLRDGHGNAVGGTSFAILFLALAEESRQYQVVQHADDRITVKIVPMVPGKPVSQRVHELTKTFCAKYLPGCPVAVEVVEDLPPGPAGKRRLVVVEPREAAREAARA